MPWSFPAKNCSLRLALRLPTNTYQRPTFCKTRPGWLFLLSRLLAYAPSGVTSSPSGLMPGAVSLSISAKTQSLSSKHFLGQEIWIYIFTSSAAFWDLTQRLKSIINEGSQHLPKILTGLSLRSTSDHLAAASSADLEAEKTAFAAKNLGSIIVFNCTNFSSPALHHLIEARHVEELCVDPWKRSQYRASQKAVAHWPARYC